MNENELLKNELIRIQLILKETWFRKMGLYETIQFQHRITTWVI